MCIDLFFIGQVFQALGFLFWSFTEFYKKGGDYRRNTIVPIVITYTCKFIFEWIPAGKVFIYLYHVYRSSLLRQIAAPFLLMSTVNCIFILLVWYKTIVTPFLEKKQSELKEYYRWDMKRADSYASRVNNRLRRPNAFNC